MASLASNFNWKGYHGLVHRFKINDYTNLAKVRHSIPKWNTAPLLIHVKDPNTCFRSKANNSCWSQWQVFHHNTVRGTAVESLFNPITIVATATERREPKHIIAIQRGWTASMDAPFPSLPPFWVSDRWLWLAITVILISLFTLHQEFIARL